MEIFKAFKIDCAHYLPGVGPEHKCSKLHGHTFRIEVHLRGPVDPNLGWVADFAEISNAFGPLQELLDHRCLNDIEGLENPTSENLARWAWKRLSPVLRGLNKIIVMESPDSGCIYEGEDEP